MTPQTPTAPSPALLAADDVVEWTMLTELAHLREDRDIHAATCRARRQGLLCSLCHSTRRCVIEAERRQAMRGGR